MKNKEKTLTSSRNNEAWLGDAIKLGIDAHKSSYVVVMKIDCSAPQRPRRFSPEKFLGWVAGLVARCGAVHSCYEAGPLGYGLHRRLLGMGISNHVIRPVNWDESGRGVKTDGRDATAMALCLDGWLRGNARSFTEVKVPTEQQERRRSLTRQREALVRERSRLSSMAKGNALYYGHSLKGRWWGPRKWAELGERLPEHLVELLEPYRQLAAAVEKRIAESERRLARMEAPDLPKGMGTVLFQTMEREVADWSRFGSGKAVGSYAGLCPSEHSSGGKRTRGSISKHGNPRLRRCLVELVWLLMKWNSGYVGIERWRERLDQAERSKSSKKRIVVAIARRLAVDWWRIRTGRADPAELGLEMKEAA